MADSEAMERWKKICNSDLFAFLKHSPTGRKILGHLWNHDISLGKAAEAIVEAFELKKESVLPEWKGIKGEDL